MRKPLFLILAYTAFSCANVLAPTGGPKDEDPPVLISTIPKQGQTNYRGSKIMLEFDELLKLQNPKDEIIVTPDIEDVNYMVKKNIVNIDFDEKLQENTTYSFAFRESIQDLNEGNPAEDLYLAFSTGDEIDSLQISGTVSQLLKGQPAEKYTIAIYQSDTFDIFKHRPSYFSRTDKNGEFKIRNLKAGDYNIYAFEDKNKNLVLESKSEKFGFLKEKISLTEHIDSISIKTIPLDSRPIALTGIRSLGHFTKVRLNKNLTTYSIISQSDNDRNIRHCFSGSQSEIDIFPTKPIGDSTQVKLIGTDSLGQKLDTMFYVKQTSAKSLKEKIKVSVSKCQLLNDVQRFSSELTTTELLKNILADSIYIQLDSVTIIPFHADDIKYDTIFRKIKIDKTFERKDSIKWKKVRFVLGGMAFTSIHGDSSVTSSSPVNLITAEETATIIIESQTVKPNTLIEVLDERLNSYGTYPQTKSLVIKNIKPGSVLLRRIDDANANGKWDPGNPNLKILPEEVSFYLNFEGKPQIPLRANWEVPIEWNF
jgi:uncharacterized protein (DUF2141 family)